MAVSRTLVQRIIMRERLAMYKGAGRHLLPLVEIVSEELVQERWQGLDIM
jgi:hypothetical protein